MVFVRSTIADAEQAENTPPPASALFPVRVLLTRGALPATQLVIAPPVVNCPVPRLPVNVEFSTDHHPTERIAPPPSVVPLPVVELFVNVLALTSRVPPLLDAPPPLLIAPPPRVARLPTNAMFATLSREPAPTSTPPPNPLLSLLNPSAIVKPLSETVAGLATRNTR